MYGRKNVGVKMYGKSKVGIMYGWQNESWQIVVAPQRHDILENFHVKRL